MNRRVARSAAAGACLLASAAGAGMASGAASTVVRGAVPAAAPTLEASTIAHAQDWSFDAVVVADVGHDGRRDVVALDRERRGVVVARSLGGGRFATRRVPRIFARGVGESLAVGDLDRDGLPDLVATAADPVARRPALAVQVAYGTRPGFGRARRGTFGRGHSGGARRPR